jgi:hypothetical protein
MATAPRHTDRGFGIYAEIQTDDGSIIVQESSVAFRGAHVWLIPDWLTGDCRTRAMTQMNVYEARKLAAALVQFAEDAEVGRLTEPVDPTPEDGDDNDDLNE